MHKLLRIVWGVLNSAMPYDPQIDKENKRKKEKPIQETQHQQLERKRRLQTFDQEAPISRMAHKKRKAHATSQSGETSKKRDLEPEPLGTNIS